MRRRTRAETSGWNWRVYNSVRQERAKGKAMREYAQGQRIRAKTYVETKIPIGRLEYTFVHEDAPGERLTIPYNVTSPPEDGKIEVVLDGQILPGQATGVYRLDSVKAYYPDTNEPAEAITEEMRNIAEFRIGLRSDYPPRANGWEYDPE
jgi:hypothetical protein